MHAMVQLITGKNDSLILCRTKLKINNDAFEIVHKV